MTILDKLLTAEETAAELSVSKHTLARWRQIGGGPRFTKIGALVRYRLSDLIKYVEAHVRDKTGGGEPDA